LLLEILDLTEGQLDVFTHSILEVLKQYAEIEPQNVLTVIKKKSFTCALKEFPKFMNL